MFSVIHVVVSANSSKRTVRLMSDGNIKIRITAPPESGKANDDIVDYMSALINVKKSQIKIIKGHLTKYKTLRITGLTTESVLSRLVLIGQKPL